MYYQHFCSSHASGRIGMNNLSSWKYQLLVNIFENTNPPEEDDKDNLLLSHGF